LDLLVEYARRNAQAFNVTTPRATETIIPGISVGASAGDSFGITLSGKIEKALGQNPKSFKELAKSLEGYLRSIERSR
jgi:hypothetical protein